MKIVKDLNVGLEPMAGCTCSSGRDATRGAFDPIWSCKCQCDGGTYNYNCNHNKADNGGPCPQ